MTDFEHARRFKDPVEFAGLLWPHVRLYDKQRESLWSVRDVPETFIVAGNKLGKDFLSGIAVLWAFLTHREVRIITTSVKDDHLRVLWGEIGRFIQTSRYPLRREHGGPLVCNHRDIRKVFLDGPHRGEICDISYLRGMVSEKGEGMAGHHAAWTLAVMDEASGVDDAVYTQCGTWAKRILAFGNPNSCAPTQFFRKNVEAGDLWVA